MRESIMSGSSFDAPETQRELAIMEMNSFNHTRGTETNCPKCKGRGYTMEVLKEFNNFYTVAVECSCMKNRKTETEVKKSGTRPLLDYSFENYNTLQDWQANIKNKAMKNAKSKDWFFLGGQSGSGKTHICSAIANYQRKNGVKVKYIVWTDEINKLKNFEDNSYMEELKRVECLYIDDFFKRPITQGNLPNLSSPDIDKTWELINFRSLNKLKTIISSELTMNDLLRVEESLGSRIKQEAGEYALSLKKDSAKNIRIQ